MIHIRESVYRGRPGFLVHGGGRGIYATRIFVRSRAGAEAVKAALKLDDRASSDRLIDAVLLAGM